jgi:PAS domain S-box-containing protein
MTRVDLHCHSTFSDGALPPERLAERLAAAGVAFASLTDHDTIDGLGVFAQHLARRGVGSIAGLEMTVQCCDREAHLLAYGFDSTHAELRATLLSLDRARNPRGDAIAQSIRKMGLGQDDAPPDDGPRSAAPGGMIEIAEAIALVHRAGGLAFLAHPLTFESDFGRLRETLKRLKADGLDGIEALTTSCSREDQEHLCALAKDLEVLVSAGTDHHHPGPPGQTGLGVEMPNELWKSFRDAMLIRAGGLAPPLAIWQQIHQPGMRRFIFHVVCPTLLAMVLFVVAIFAVFLPTMDRTLMDRQREMCRELTNSAWSILAEAHRQEQTGALSREQAQQSAKARIAALRYGREGKDYFWLQDMHPRILMHPYRTDLNNQDVSEFRDPRGACIFVEFVNLVRERNAGFVEYVWQWKDDPGRLVPKESYVRGFEPWGWIIGTGIYTDDVRQELTRIERNVTYVSLGISAVVVLLLSYVMRAGLRLERGRAQAEENLYESRERYRSLVEATTEGMLLVVEDRCRYANPILLDMLGYTHAQLELLELADIAPVAEDSHSVWESLNRLRAGQQETTSLDGYLRRRDGALVECVLTLSLIRFAEKRGIILLAREVRPRVGTGELGPGGGTGPLQLDQVAEGAAVGLFRARADRRGLIIEANQVAGEMLCPLSKEGRGSLPSLPEIFPDTADYDEFLAQLQRDGFVERQLLVTTSDAGSRVVRLRTRLGRDKRGQPRFIDGSVEDVTQGARRQIERDALIEKMQTSLLFLQQPVDRLEGGPVFCEYDTPIRKVAALMTAQATTAALVRSETGTVLGLVTDHDLRSRVLAVGLDMSQPVHRIMSSPIVTIPLRAPVCEAMLLMQEKGVEHLALEDESGCITGVIRARQLLQFPSHGAIAITSGIANAATAEEVSRYCRQTPGLVKSLLDSGAHPHNIARLVASVCDAATEKFVSLAQNELGPAPTPFAFLALGSQGRLEQTLCTDQDNAILHAPVEDEAQAAQVSSYFRELGERVCTWLNQAGYRFCNGGVMAKNPKWRLALPAWKECFSNWIARAEPQELLEFSIFFDFRCIVGDPALARDLRRHVHEALRSCQAFLPHFAQNSLLFKPQLRLFGRVLADSPDAAHPGQINLKDAMMPIVNFARLYALNHGLGETNTLDRLNALVEQGELRESNRDEIIIAYDVLMRLRLRQQITAIQAGQTPDNFINHRRLGNIEETLLKQSFVQIDAVQKKISYDFLGGTR